MASLRERTCGALLAAVALSCVAPVARASDDAGAAAETLFREGKRLMDAGDFAAACPKLTESQRLDPGNGTLARLATCHEKEGRIATAWSEFSDLVTSAARAGQTDREKFARQRVAALQPQLSRLSLRVPADVAAIPNLKVRRDAIDVGSAAWGIAVPLDPGEHRLEATAPGRKPWSATITIGAAADQREVTVPALEIDPQIASASNGSNASAPVESTTPAPASDRAPVPSAGGTQRIVGITVGVVGVVGLGLGTYFGVQALSDASGAKRVCPGATCSNLAGVQQNDDAKSNARVADVVIPLSIAGVVGGSLLYLLAPRGVRVEPTVGRVNGVRVEAAW
jgi:serine/threonine-protein kinase